MYTVNYDKDITLFHGSRGGIAGDIKPISRERCDFGQAFYMGTNPEQAKSLVSNDSDPYFYKLRLNLTQISKDKILELKDMTWAYFVLYNRGKLNSIKNTEFYQQIKNLGKDKDLIIGPIADDAMNETMKKFVKGEITDKAFLESIRVIDYGIQYAAITESACSQIKILSERELFGAELTEAKQDSDIRKYEGITKAEEIQKKYRREGKYLDEILHDVSRGKGITI